MEITVFYNLIWKLPLILCALFCLLEVSRSSCSQEVGIIQGSEWRRRGTLQRVSGAAFCRWLGACAMKYGFFSSPTSDSETSGELCTFSEPPFSYRSKYNNSTYIIHLL